MDLGGPPRTLRAARIVAAEGAADAADLVIERLRDEARAEGFAAGVAAARGEAARALHGAAERLDACREESRASLARTAVELAVEIARCLVAAEVEAGRHGVEEIVRETLMESGVGRGACVVHLHPDDARALEGVPFRAGTQLVPDIGVRRGDAQIETPNGLFVRDLDDAVRTIGRRILESLR